LYSVALVFIVSPPNVFLFLLNFYVSMIYLSIKYCVNSCRGEKLRADDNGVSRGSALTDPRARYTQTDLR
jgi:hypothetical protein